MNTLTLAGASRFLLMGIILIVLGALPVTSPAVAGTAVVYVIGGMLLLSMTIRQFNKIAQQAVAA
jgi:uncharacterized membrane protein HdeD (DUF308 family)